MITTSVTSSHLNQLSYAVTPEEICSLGSKLNYTAFKLYLYFKTQQQAENGAIRFQATEIMERLGICRSTLRKAMTALEGLLPFRFKPVREWELQFQAEEPETEATSTVVIPAQESLVESSVVTEVVATPETTKQTDSDAEYSANVFQATEETIAETEEIEAEEYCEEESQKQAEKAWSQRILQEVKEKMIVAESLENLKELKRLYGANLAIAAWHLLNPEEQERVKAIAQGNLQSEASAPVNDTPTTEILQPGVAVEIWQNGVWLGGYRYLGQGDIFISSERTYNLEIAHEVEDCFGIVYKLAKSDLRLKELS